jgi:ABC-type protease/lipase transport system fused ATPase/permease subunit
VKGRSEKMTQEISLDEYKRAYREIREEEEKRGFLAHSVVYVLANAMLIAINFIYSPEVIWFFYPLIGWGIGISMHYLFGVRWLEKALKEREAKAEYRAGEMKK